MDQNSSNALVNSIGTTEVINIKIPSDNDFDQQTARYLLEKCSTLIVEHFPIGSEFGIDLSIHYTGKQFLGLKMIPPGLHFVHFSFVNQQQCRVSPRIGFFYYFLSGECLVTKWDSKEEDIILTPDDHVQVKRLYDNFQQRHLDTQLGAYQFSTYQNWVSLTDYISEDLFHRMNPKCGKIYSASNLVYKPNPDGSIPVKPSFDSQGLPDMIISPESAIQFKCQTPKRNFLYPAGSSPSEISHHSMDSTYTLNYLIEMYFDGREIDMLGEMQFAFITFLLGHVYESFEHWLNMTRIICHAQSALIERTQFFLSFIRVLHFQLKQTDEAIFADIVQNENQLYAMLKRFFNNVRTEPGVSEELKRRANMFRCSLEKKRFTKWKFVNLFSDNSLQQDIEDDEAEDEKPVVVFDVHLPLDS